MAQDIPDGPGIAGPPHTHGRLGLNLRVRPAGLLAQPIPECVAAPVAQFAGRSGEGTAR